MKRNSASHLLPIAIGLLAGVSAPTVRAEGTERYTLTAIPPAIPDGHGGGGVFAGVSNGALIIAGGVSSSEETSGEQTIWHDNIAVLAPDADQWQTGFSLPGPLAYGVSISTDFGLVCIGGRDAHQPTKTVLVLEWLDGDVNIATLPDLPAPRAHAAGALVGDVIYVAAGRSASREDEVTGTFWGLRLPRRIRSAPIDWKTLRWETLPDLPGPPRAQALAAGQAGRFYLVGGWCPEPDSDPPTGRYLNDAYRFDPRGNRWASMASFPKAGIAGGAACGLGDSHVFVFGGYEGRDELPASTSPEDPPGYGCDIFAYHTITDTWTAVGLMPVGLTAANAVWWQNHVVIPGGRTGPSDYSNQTRRLEVVQPKPAFGVLNIAVLVVYLGSLVIMGFYFSRREKTTADFFVGGRRIPWWAVGISIFGTQLSSISFMAIPAKAYDTDWSYYVVVFCIVLVQPLVVYFYLPFFRRLNVTSAYEYLEKRFSATVRLLGSASFILFQTGRMTIVLFLPSLALSAVTGINIYTCILIMGVLATVYTVLGGIEAVVWTDLLQVIVLVGGGLMCLGVMAFDVEGGLGGIIKVGRADGKFNWVDLSWDYTQPVLWVIVVGNLFQQLISYTADQAVIQRYLTTRDEKTAAAAIWTNAVISIPVTMIWFAIGTTLYVFYKSRPELLRPELKTDQVFPMFIAQQLPDGVAGLVIAGLFAASMSTIDSSLNSIATAFVTDFYRRFRKTARDRTCLVLARGLTVAFGGVGIGTALWMAANQEHIRSLWDAYMAVLGLLMGSLAGLFALGIFTRRANHVGAIVGAVGASVLTFFVQSYTEVSFYLYAAVGIIGCLVIGYLVSLLLPGVPVRVDGLTVYTQTRGPNEKPPPLAGRG